MKRFFGWLSVLIVLAGCGKTASIETRRATSLSAELVAIDSLMQARPDSALTMLLDSPMDDHYYQLLLSEAFYKNDSAQLNRQELLQAMAYFDSVGNAFLAARCHYMNGVGYYEMDSVVPACAAYLKALEIMEDRFKDEELTGHKAKFMALTNTHLCGLFSDQYLSKQTIYFGVASLPYYNKYNSDSWHIAWIYNKIGAHYYIINELDSADYYFERALSMIPDTNMLTYRDVTAARTMLSYNKGTNPQLVLEQMHTLLAKSESNGEYLARCLSIGGVYYDELQFDSAWIYLNKVFNESVSINTKKQAAEWLIEISKAQGKENEILEYTSFLAPFANQEENKSELKSQLTELYKSYTQEKLERQHRDKIRNNKKRATIVLLSLLLLMLFLVILYHRNKKKKQNLEIQIKAEKLSHEMKQKALSGRLKNSNETLRETLKKIEDQEAHNKYNESKEKGNTIERYENFKQTPICQEIFDMVEQLHNDKRNTLKTDMDIAGYKSFALSTAQLVLLSKTVEQFFPNLYASLKMRYPSMKQKDWRFCLLYLLHLDKLSICVLLQEPYHTCRRYTLKLEQAFRCEHGLTSFITEQVLCS